MSLKVAPPGVTQPVVDAGGIASRPYYVFFQSVATSLQSLSDQIGNVTTTPTDSPFSENASVTGAYSIYTRGTLKTGIVKVFLLGDVETPGATQYYGSNASGEKGWHAVSDALADSANVTLTTDTDGVSTFDLSDTGITAGTYGDEANVAVVTFDAKGRSTGVSEKAIRTLSDAAPSSPVAGMRWIDTTTGTEYVWYVDADSSQWVEFGPNAVSVADGPAVQTVSSGDLITVDNTDPANPIINYTGPVSGYAEGNSFPASPSVNSKYYRNDLHLLCYFDGTRWLSVQEYEMGSMASIDSVSAISADSVVWRGPVRSDYGIYLTRWVSSFRTGATNNATNYWNVSLWRQDAAIAATSIASYTSASDSASAITQHDTQINAVLNTSARHLFVQTAKTGAPSACFQAGALYYRLIVT